MTNFTTKNNWLYMHIEDEDVLHLRIVEKSGDPVELTIVELNKLINELKEKYDEMTNDVKRTN